MKSLKELIKGVSFEDAWHYVCLYYSEMMALKAQYYNVFTAVLDLQPVDNIDNTTLYIDRVDTAAEDTDEAATAEYRVHAKREHSDWAGYYDISMCRWEEWLGFTVADSVMQQFEPAEILALCLYEMTWLGCDYERVNDKIRSFKDKGSV